MNINIGQHLSTIKDIQLKSKVKDESAVDETETSETEEASNQSSAKSTKAGKKIDFSLLEKKSTKKPIERTKPGIYKGKGSSSFSVKQDQDGNISHVKVVDNNGKTILDSEVSESSLENLQNQLNSLQQQSDAIQQQIHNIKAPHAPSPQEFVKINNEGKQELDQNAYFRALQEYEKECDEYNAKILELTSKSNEISVNIAQIVNNINVIGRLLEINNAQQGIKELKESENGDNPVLDKLQEELDKQKDEYAKALLEVINSSADLENLSAQLSNMKPPVPPSPYDFMNDNYELDEHAYADAMSEYEAAKADYDKQQTELHQKLAKAENNAQHARMHLDNVQASINAIEYNTNNLIQLKSQIDEAEDPELKSELQSIYDKLCSNIEKRLEIGDKISDINNELESTPMPVPPTPYDYLVTVIEGKDANGNEVGITHNSDGTFTVSIPDSDGNYIEVQGEPQYDASGNLVAVRLPDGSYIKASQHEELDQIAYGSAMAKYEDDVNAMKDKFNKLGAKTTELQTQDMNLDIESNLLLAEAKFKSLMSKMTDPELKAALQAEYDKLVENLQKQRTVNMALLEANKELSQLDYPSPPSPFDYIVTVIEGIDENGNNVQIEPNSDGSFNVIITPQEGVMVVQQGVPQYDSNGNIVAVVLPNGSEVKVTQHKELDQVAYGAAMNEYEAQKEVYDRNIQELNQKIAAIQQEDARLDREIQTISETSNIIRDCDNALSGINKMIENAKNPMSQAMLVQKRDELKDIISKVLDNDKQIQKTVQDINNLDIPAAPSPYDYLVTTEEGKEELDQIKYGNAMAQYDAEVQNYNQQRESLESKLSLLYKNREQFYADMKNIYEQASHI